ncbi:uncharacterized protein LOC125550737 isoform X1 [Triticum urartu]|uniref:uncharacterized protein LOC125550737 isoform X1 n=1 Tax=Triticum urartu TaxID=4572 RepID=UPI002044A845|nr:uncharacterized protein LOC125550737 isoform X1 [Triticum urartu]
MLRSPRFDDQNSRSGEDLVKKREGRPPVHRREGTARPEEWAGLGPRGPRALLNPGQKRQGPWRFKRATSAKTAGSDSLWARSKTLAASAFTCWLETLACSAFLCWVKTPRTLAFLKGSNREILSRRVQFVTINANKVRTVILPEQNAPCPWSPRAPPERAPPCFPPPRRPRPAHARLSPTRSVRIGPLSALAHQVRAYWSLISPAASRGGRRSTRLRVRAARLESTGVSVGFRAPQFELPEPLTGKIWTLDDFEGSPALLVSESLGQSVL